MIKKYLPRSLLGRTVLIIVIPLILLQLVSAGVFYESHWSKVSLRLARNLAGDIAAVIELMRQNPTDAGRQGVISLASGTLALQVSFEATKIMPNVSKEQTGGFIDHMLIRSLRESINRPFDVDSQAIDKHVKVSIQLTDGILVVVANKKRLFSSTTYIFVLWMVGTAMILFGVAVIFMRNQVRPIRRLAAAADNFGKDKVLQPYCTPNLPTCGKDGNCGEVLYLRGKLSNICGDSYIEGRGTPPQLSHLPHRRFINAPPEVASAVLPGPLQPHVIDDLARVALDPVSKFPGISRVRDRAAQSLGQLGAGCVVAVRFCLRGPAGDFIG